MVSPSTRTDPAGPVHDRLQQREWIIDEAITDFLYLDVDAVLITESDDLSSR